MQRQLTLNVTTVPKELNIELRRLSDNVQKEEAKAAPHTATEISPSKQEISSPIITADEESILDDDLNDGSPQKEENTMQSEVLNKTGSSDKLSTSEHKLEKLETKLQQMNRQRTFLKRGLTVKPLKKKMTVRVERQETPISSPKFAHTYNNFNEVSVEVSGEQPPVLNQPEIITTKRMSLLEACNLRRQTIISRKVESIIEEDKLSRKMRNIKIKELQQTRN